MNCKYCGAETKWRSYKRTIVSVYDEYKPIAVWVRILWCECGNPYVPSLVAQRVNMSVQHGVL